MRVNELLNNMAVDGFDIESALEVNKYIPFDVKKAIAQSIIYECSVEEDGVVKYDYVQQQLARVRHMITVHTNLEYTDDDYDILCDTMCGEKSLRDIIMQCFSNDIKEFDNVLELSVKTYLQEMNVEFTVAQFLHNMSTSINKVANVIATKVDNADIKSMIPDGIDMDKLGSFLQTYIK